MANDEAKLHATISYNLGKVAKITEDFIKLKSESAKNFGMLIKSLKQSIRSKSIDADTICLGIIDSIAGGLRFRENELIKENENYTNFSRLLAIYVNLLQTKCAYSDEFLYGDNYLEIIERRLRVLYYALSSVNKDIIHSKFLQVLTDTQEFIQKSTNFHQRATEEELSENIPSDLEEDDPL